MTARVPPGPEVEGRPPPDPEVKGRPAPRPRDAATLILVRRDGPEPALLMGCRHKAHVFMPNMFAFPGGGVDRSDAGLTPETPFPPETEERLRKASPRRAPASLGLAAIRETFEETGLRVGLPRLAVPQTHSKSWARFFASGTAPALHGLTFAARAITPPGQKRRFDARFFLVEAQHIHGDPDDFSQSSGELTHLQWVPLSRIRDLDLPYITRVILGFIEPRLAAPEKDLPVPFVYERYGRQCLDHL